MYHLHVIPDGALNRAIATLCRPVARTPRPLYAVLFTLVTAITGCASNVPPLIKTMPDGSPTITDVRANNKDLIGKTVRWGGTIASVRNKETETWVEVVERELRKSGEPMDSDKSRGRFIARVIGFLDPAIYEQGRKLTVYGTLEKPVVQPIGEFTYLYPVVTVESQYLWEETPDTVYVEPGSHWMYDPWFYPYRPPYYYPYWNYRPYW